MTCSVIVKYNTKHWSTRRRIGSGCKGASGDMSMKFLRLTLSVLLISFSTVAFAQSNAQKSFDALKALAGPWEGPVSTVPKEAAMGDQTNVQISMRVTSRGNALVH